MKNIKRILLVLVLMVLLTGCGANNAKPETVSEAMLKMLIKNDYKGAKDVFYHEDSYFSDEVFAQIIKDKGLVLTGMKSYKLANVGNEITDESGNPTVAVSYELANGKKFTFNTIKVNGKWYVYDKSFYNGDISIAVPKGSKVEFDGTKLKDASQEEKDVIVRHDKMSYGTTIYGAKVDVYTVKNVLKGEYPVTITNGDKEIKEVIGSYSKYKSSSNNNYSYKLNSSEGNYNITYVFNVDTENKKVESFVTDFYKNVYSAANEQKEFKDVSKYFASDSKNISGMTSTYNILVSRVKGGHYVNYKADLKINKIYDYGNYVGVVGDLSLKYSYKGYSGNDVTEKKETKYTTLILEKGKSGYSLYGGNNYLPYY